MYVLDCRGSARNYVKKIRYTIRVVKVNPAKGGEYRNVRRQHALLHRCHALPFETAIDGQIAQQGKGDVWREKHFKVKALSEKGNSEDFYRRGDEL